MSVAKTRLYNFANDSAASTPISSAKIDAELDAVIAALNQKVQIKSTAPGTPVDGQTWVDLSTDPPTLKIYDQTNAGWTPLITIASPAQGGTIYHNGTQWTQLAAGTAGQTLVTGGAAANPAWGGMTTQGDVEFRSATTRARLAAGTSGMFLKTLGTGADPAWAYITRDIGARAYASGQSIANNTATAVALANETYDTDTIHDNSTNNSRLTSKTAGKYIITGYAAFDVNGTGIRAAEIRLNGTTRLTQATGTTAGSPTVSHSVATLYSLAVNDYVELVVTQTSGDALNLSEGNLAMSLIP